MSRIDEMGWDGGRIEPEDVDHPGLRELLGSLDKLTAVRPSDTKYRAAWSALCPAHDDNNPSLSIGWLANGRITIKCFAGCTRASVLAAAGVDPASVAPPRSSFDESSVEAIYEYLDEDGSVLYRVYRFRGKRIRYRRPDGKGGWEWKRGERRVLYRLPELIAAATAGTRVFVCEGEKDTDRLAALGLTATCNPGGAGKWEKAFSKFLQGADVVLMQDNDEPGANHVCYVAQALRGIAKSIRIVLLPDLPAKGDVSDWLDAGHTKDELLAISEAAPAVTDASDQSDSELGDEAEARMYAEDDHGLWRLGRRGGPRVRIANFTARITKQITDDDGVTKTQTLELRTIRAGRQKTIGATAAEFAEMKWPGEKIDVRASISPTANPREVCYVIRLLSRDIEETTTYTHTGWTRLEDGTPVYLHAKGAIGPEGSHAGIRVRLHGPLSGAALPEPPTGEDLKTSVRDVLSLLTLSEARVMIPLLAAAFRAPLGASGFSIHMFGPTGIGKTQLAVLVQQFFGAEFNWDKLPGNWSSTANAIEGLLFAAKDMVVVVDDFNPRGAQADVQRLHQAADRVFRGAANIAARARMDRDANLRPPKPPRAFVVSTGEEAPTGHSLAARIMLIELADGDVDFNALSEAQQKGHRGSYAACMSAFLQYHARSFANFEERKADVISELRKRASREGYHRRTPDATANGLLGWLRFLEFAAEVDGITEDERGALEARGWQAFEELARLQARYQARENPARLFVALIDGAIQGELAHLSTFSNSAPPNWAECGWRRDEGREHDVIRCVGPRIGYIDHQYVYLIPEMAYKTAQDTARGGTHNLSVAPVTLGKRLLAEGLRAPGETRGGKDYSTRRKTLPNGKRTGLWTFRREVFGLSDGPDSQGDTPTGDGSPENGYEM